MEVGNGNSALVHSFQEMLLKPRGRSENRIFGNRPLPEEGANQFLSGFVLFRRLPCIQEPLVRSLEVSFSVLIRSNPALRKRDQRTAHGEVAFLSDTPDFGGQGRGNGYAASHRHGGYACRFSRSRFVSLHLSTHSSADRNPTDRTCSLSVVYFTNPLPSRSRAASAIVSSRRYRSARSRYEYPA